MAFSKKKNYWAVSCATFSHRNKTSPRAIWSEFEGPHVCCSLVCAVVLIQWEIIELLAF